MPLFMDIHIVDSEDFTVEDVVKAHMQDLAIQDRFSVRQIKYWVNVPAKTLFCLMEGPDKDACNKVHKESHGNTACNIIEVFDDEFNLFMGEGKSLNDLAHTVSGEIDTGYRTILMVSPADVSGRYAHTLEQFPDLMKRHKGAPVLRPGDDFMASFVLASDAIACSLSVEALLNAKGLEFTLSVISGRPVDERGENLFEETRRKGKCLCALGMGNAMYLDVSAKSLAEKESARSASGLDRFKIVEEDDLLFLQGLYELLCLKIPDENFRSDQIYGPLGMSKSQAYRKIKSLTGHAPNQLIQELRLRLSLREIRQDRKTVSEVAFDLGFNSPAYFTRVFKTRFGVTPSACTDPAQ